MKRRSKESVYDWKSFLITWKLSFLGTGMLSLKSFQEDDTSYSLWVFSFILGMRSLIKGLSTSHLGDQGAVLKKDERERLHDKKRSNPRFRFLFNITSGNRGRSYFLSLCWCGWQTRKWKKKPTADKRCIMTDRLQTQFLFLIHWTVGQRLIFQGFNLFFFHILLVIFPLK